MAPRILDKAGAIGRRTTGKTSRNQLLLVHVAGDTILLFEGPEVTRWYDLTRRFFEDKTVSRL